MAQTQLIKMLLCAAFMLMVVSCTEQSMTSQEEMIEMEEPDPSVQDSIYFLALGDSYTIGQGVDISQRWPNQLRAQLIDNEINVYDSKIIARTGWTTSQLIKAIEDEDLTFLSDQNVMVSLLIGVNNQFQGLDFDDFKTEFDLLLARAMMFAQDKERVFVVSIPDYGVTPFGSGNSEEIGRELDMYNAYMSGQCESLDILYVDITEISRELGDSENALATDNLHPSGFQYSQWVDKIFPLVLEQLTE